MHTHINIKQQYSFAQAEFITAYISHGRLALQAQHVSTVSECMCVQCFEKVFAPFLLVAFCFALDFLHICTLK